MPSQKQIQAFQKTVENHGNVSRAMLEAGYTPATAKNPKNLTESKGWKELMDEYIPDDLLAKVHLEGLQANRVISANIKYGEADEQTNDFIEVPDHSTRHKFLDSAYKLKGSYAAEKHTNLNINVTPILSGLSRNNSNKEDPKPQQEN